MKFISLKQAVEISGYTQDYLGSLIREKKLKGKKIGRDWFTTERAVKRYISTKKFLPIREFLSFKAHPKLILSFTLIAIVIVVIIVGVVSIFISPVHSQISPGDFENENEPQGAEFQ